MLSNEMKAFLNGLFANVDESTNPAGLIKAFLCKGPSELDGVQGGAWSMARSFCSRFEAKFGLMSLAHIVKQETFSRNTNQQTTQVLALFWALFEATVALCTPKCEFSSKDDLSTLVSLHLVGMKSGKQNHSLIEKLNSLALCAGTFASSGLVMPERMTWLKTKNPKFAEYFRCGLMLRNHCTEEAMEALETLQRLSEDKPGTDTWAFDPVQLGDTILEIMTNFNAEGPAPGIVRKLLDGLSKLPGGIDELKRVQNHAPTHWCGHFDS